MGLENYQFGEGDPEAFRGEKPFVDQKGNGRPWSPDERAAQKLANDQLKIKKAKKLGRRATDS